MRQTNKANAMFAQKVLAELRKQRSFKTMTADWNAMSLICLNAIGELEPYSPKEAIVEMFLDIARLYAERVVRLGGPFRPMLRLALFECELCSRLLEIPGYRSALIESAFVEAVALDEELLKGVVIQRITPDETLQALTDDRRRFFARAIVRAQKAACAEVFTAASISQTTRQDMTQKLFR